ncbi:MAG: hypothetical protein R2847_06865 [Bacteroidia bacterium]
MYNKITVYLQSVKSGELNVAAFMLNELEELNALTNRYKEYPRLSFSGNAH